MGHRVGQTVRQIAQAAAYTVVVAATMLAGGRPAMAEPDPVVVELFTSQGCSACPPADALLAELAARDDVIALALHVDYWDYIGWADVFARPEFTRRQQDYAHAAGQRMVYTPQMIVGGSDPVRGVRPVEVMDLVAAHAALPRQVTLQVARDGEVVRISADPAAGAPPGEVSVQIVRFTPEAVVDILQGENAGHTFAYSNIVTDWRVVATWDGRGPLRLDHRVTGPDPVVVILQQVGPGRILSAATLR